MPNNKALESGEVHAQGQNKPQTMAGQGVEELRHRIDVLEAEKRRDEKAHNYLQIERDRVMEFWQVTKKKLARAEGTIRDHSIVVQELVNSHASDLKAYRQRLRYLLIEQADKEAQLRLESQAVLQQLRETAAAAQTAAAATHETALAQERTTRLTAEHETAQCKIECEKNIDAKCKEFEAEVNRLQVKYEADWMAMQRCTQEACATEIRVAEGKMEAALLMVRQQQATALQELHDLLETKSLAHQAALSALQEENKALADREAAARREAKAATTELKTITEAQQQTQAELATITKQLGVAKTEASLLESTKKRAATLEKKVRRLELENEALRVQLEGHGVPLPSLHFNTDQPS